MKHTLPPLNFAKDALSPFISAETVEYHYDKHHKIYVDNLNKSISKSIFKDKTLEEIVKTTAGEVFNNAAQVWNHNFYWAGLTPNVGGEPTELLAEAIKSNFKSLNELKTRFNEAALSLFGSGWTWLIKKDGKLEIINTKNANNPLTTEQKPLLACDLWEHAYYIDYHNARSKYLESFWQIVNWDFVLKNFS